MNRGVRMQTAKIEVVVLNCKSFISPLELLCDNYQLFITAVSAVMLQWRPSGIQPVKISHAGMLNPSFSSSAPTHMTCPGCFYDTKRWYPTPPDFDTQTDQQ